MHRPIVRLIIALTMVCSAALAAQAQEYPTKPIRMVVPYPAGGVADVTALIRASDLLKNWGNRS